MRRVLWLAPLLATALAGAPLLARVCEARCAARASHCHEEAPKAPGGCPEKSHRTEAPSLAAAKIAAAASGDVIGQAAAAAGFIVSDASMPAPPVHAPRGSRGPDLASLRVLRL